MKYLAAYLLATLGGNASPSANDLKKIIKTIGADVDDEKVDAVVAALNGKDIDEVIADGFSKLSAAPVASGSAGAAAGGAGAAAEAAEEAKEEEEEEESDSDMGFGLFD
ncbi:ribosomal protein 60S [Anaeromyces robustus]|uniref:Ribosomal protein 60S n=1 Tax=Anaeromyces robustus TaxID=1754192 RepID=A0A1Y1VD95_9FUNG|nr:ribosomal protein 60S [Anaeromyces robustus]ORX88022.1 ribosomal protein 60S [Anaeromyces robustus]|eukprot:ORX52274.1 ribosomal protein 60S [Anaeromyces robustus]